MNTHCSIQVVYQDEILVVLNKPAGLLSVPGKGPDKQDCLSKRVQEHLPSALIVHRLDMATSGLIVMALDPQTHRQLSRQFELRQVDKTYTAMVAGVMTQKEGVIDLPMRLDVENRPHQIIDHEQGKQAMTHWRVIERLGDRTRIELKPTTGRTHQLRLHLQQIGHPILGDMLYAPADVQLKTDRLMLHATMLAFDHPSTGQRVIFENTCPF